MDLFNNLLIVFFCILAVPTLVFSMQVFLAPGAVEATKQTDRRPRLAVLVPAHNEAAVIADTLHAIGPQLAAGDRLLVVADNCTDNTAALARACHATVIERQDQNRRGKGYALDFGLQFLANNQPPEVVIIIDADCQLSPSCIDILSRQVEIENKPVQALYMMKAPENKSLTQAIAEFAWVVKNRVRPLGMAHLGLPCQLMGTGMAFPWSVLRQADLAHGNMVEDMKLGIDLALLGFPPSFCPNAWVSSEFPISELVTDNQRKRWEHGHLATIFTETPSLLKAALLRRDISLLAMALDLSVPPLSALGLVLVMALCLSGVLTVVRGDAPPFLFMATLCSTFATAVLTSWYRFGRENLAFKTLCGAPFYLLRKIPLYLGFLIRRQQEWVKTERR